MGAQILPTVRWAQVELRQLLRTLKCHKRCLGRKKKQKSIGLNTNKNAVVKEITQIATLGKKLIIFDVNRLLGDAVSPPPKGLKADKVIPKRAIFKRPFLNDFLCFCFERFNVRIWSSRTEEVLNPVLDFLLGDLMKKIAFFIGMLQNAGILG